MLRPRGFRVYPRREVPRRPGRPSASLLTISTRYNSKASACLTYGLLPAVVVAPGKVIRRWLSGSLMWETEREPQTVVAIPMAPVADQIFGDSLIWHHA
jgi:hypothetical protein